MIKSKRAALGNHAMMSVVGTVHPPGKALNSTTLLGESRSRRVATPARRAVILAAGIGARLMPNTSDSPKCLVAVNGVPLLCHTLGGLAAAGVREVVVVVGHEGQQVRSRVGTSFASMAVRYVEAPRFQTTNNICSLWEAREFCDQDVLLLEGDVIFDPEMLTHLQEFSGSSMAVAPHHSSLSGTVVRRDSQGYVTAFALSEDQRATFDFSDTFKTVNIYLLRATHLKSDILPELERQIAEGNVHTFYESIFRDLVARGSLSDLLAIDVSANRWYEIDTHRDLEVAEFLFLDRDAQFERMQELHGSYWRYGLADHAHPGLNPYFPPPAMMETLREELLDITRSYPVGQKELARLVGNWTGAVAEGIAVGNGASELIKVLGDHFVDRLAIPVPTFNEYENVMPPGRIERFPLQPPAFDLDVDAFAESVVASKSDLAVVISPNLPTARSTPQPKIIALAERLAKNGCRLVVDESFIDYSSAGAGGSVSTLTAAHSNLVLIKSMVKVFGVPGLRIGYLLSSDREFVAAVRSRLPIWNVNGLAEAFLRQVGTHRAEFEASCALVRETYLALYEQLCELPGLDVLEPDADFVLCKITKPGIAGREVARQLYVRYQIMVRDCSHSTMPEADRYLRIASRTTPENQRLVEALASLGLG